MSSYKNITRKSGLMFVVSMFIAQPEGGRYKSSSEVTLGNFPGKYPAPEIFPTRIPAASEHSRTLKMYGILLQVQRPC